MGLTHVTTTFRSLAGRGRGFFAEFLVDTGAIDCLAPAKALRKAGIKPEGKNVHELADGSRVELEMDLSACRCWAKKPSHPSSSGPTDQNPSSGSCAGGIGHLR